MSDQTQVTLGSIAEGLGSPATPVAVSGSVRQRRGPDKTGFYWGTGRRKTAVARVRLKAGSGKYLVNDKEVDVYFTETRDRGDVVNPLKLTKAIGNVDVFVNVAGGGYAGQAGAVVMGLARALMEFDPTLEPTLREHDLLSRDSRKVERKKYGQSGARRRFQFSKR
jgi:small subunit ribosomal protein S9